MESITKKDLSIETMDYAAHNENEKQGSSLVRILAKVGLYSGSVIAGFLGGCEFVDKVLYTSHARSYSFFDSDWGNYNSNVTTGALVGALVAPLAIAACSRIYTSKK